MNPTNLQFNLDQDLKDPELTQNGIQLRESRQKFEQQSSKSKLASQDDSQKAKIDHPAQEYAPEQFVMPQDEQDQKSESHQMRDSDSIDHKNGHDQSAEDLKSEDNTPYKDQPETENQPQEQAMFKIQNMESPSQDNHPSMFNQTGSYKNFADQNANPSAEKVNPGLQIKSAKKNEDQAAAEQEEDEDEYGFFSESEN